MTNVIGAKGILLQSKVKDPDGQKDQLAIDAVETGWVDLVHMGHRALCSRQRSLRK